MVGCINPSEAETLCAGWPLAYDDFFSRGDSDLCTCGPLVQGLATSYIWTECLEPVSSSGDFTYFATCSKVRKGKRVVDMYVCTYVCIYVHTRKHRYTYEYTHT